MKSIIAYFDIIIAAIVMMLFSPFVAAGFIFGNIRDAFKVGMALDDLWTDSIKKDFRYIRRKGHANW